MIYSFACLHYFQFWSEWFQWSFQVGINLLTFFWTSFYINLWRESVICIEYGLKSFWLWNADKRKDLQKAWIVEWFEDPDPQGIRVFIFLTISCFTEITYTKFVKLTCKCLIAANLVWKFVSIKSCKSFAWLELTWAVLEPLHV